VSASGADPAPPAEEDALVTFAGVDEAGLGPILGPLTLGYSVFRAPRSAVNLWNTLEPIVARKSRRGSEAFVVADSKEVFTRNKLGAQRLESTVLGFLALLDPDRDPRRAAADYLWKTPPALAPRPEYLAAPWYQGLDLELPAALDASLLELRIEKLSRALRAGSVEMLDAGVSVHPAAQLNVSFERTRNKSQTHWDASKSVFRHLWQEHAPAGLRLVVDRHGGRFRYAPLLKRAFPEATIEILREHPQRAEYDVRERTASDAAEPRRMRVTFAEKAENRSFPTALGSCLAKYARETAMHAFNRYFATLQPDLKPTAGYTTDGRRWLEDAQPAVEMSGVERDTLVRQR